ncbi:MAG TPA: DUF58 domain-containing protein [Planctomycetota bacterium]|jgi:uncharacterized protein (DUF58 family)|nr:DUF58 domain-containing protein [Planctomycetota bacterium]
MEEVFGEEFFRRLARVRLRLATGWERGAGPLAGAGASPRGVEFRDHRPYAPGDDLRSVDWHALGRLGRPFVKVFRDESRGSLGIVLDATASMAFGVPRKDLVARRVAGALGLAALAAGSPVSAAVAAERVGRRRFEGRASAGALLALLSAQAGGRAEVLVEAIEGLGSAPTSAFLVVSDFLDRDPVFRAVERVLRPGRPGLLVQVQSREELEPDLSGRVRLLDAETGETLEGTVDEEALRRSAARARGLEEEVRGFALRRRLGSVFVRSDRDFEDASLEALTRLEALR